MTTIDLLPALKDLDGNPIPGDTQGQLLAKCLANSSQGNALKFWEWAMALHQNKELKLDTSDVDTLTKFVNDCPQLTALSKAQILISIKAGKQS